MFNESDAKVIGSIVSLNELKFTLAVFQKSKSSGPNGWTLEFFEYFVDLVGPNIKEAIKEIQYQWKNYQINECYIHCPNS